MTDSIISCGLSH